jgi:hypothetical protein
MADKTADADHFARDPRTTAAASSANALKPIMLFQVSILGNVGPQHREVRGQL